MSSFHHFQRLPPELRCQIWRLAMEPQEIRFVPDKHYYPGNFSLMLPKTPVAPLLHACPESRILMENLYTKATPAFRISGSPYLWVNYDLDTVFLRRHQLLRPNGYMDPDLIQRLNIEYDLSKGYAHFVPRLHQICGLVPSLPSLTDVLLDFATPPEHAVLRGQPWHPILYAIMVDYYAICRPVHFTLRITDKAYGPDAVLSHDNFLSLMQELTPSNRPTDMTGGRQFLGYGTRLRSDQKGRADSIWKHVGCDCDMDMDDSQRRWTMRPTLDTLVVPTEPTPEDLAE